MTAMKIMLVDDHILFREGVASLINTQPDLHVVGEVGTVKDVVEIAHSLLPDAIRSGAKGGC
jgi:two-component system nitrate/nitrite response regulator NarL